MASGNGNAIETYKDEAAERAGGGRVEKNNATTMHKTV